MSLFSSYAFGEESEVKTDYWENGKILFLTHYKNDKPHGRHTRWYEDGKKESEFLFKNGSEEEMHVWYESGTKEKEEYYDNGKITGRPKKWSEDGRRIYKENLLGDKE